MSDPRRRIHLAGAASAVLCTFLFARHVILRLDGTTFDDAYMFFRYAGHILQGMGPAWNPGEPPIYGATSLLYLALVTLLRGIAPAAEASVLLVASSAASAYAAVWILALSCARYCRGALAGIGPLPWTGALLPLFLGAAPFRYHATTGMDTTLSLLVLSLLVLSALRLETSPTLPALAVTALVGYAAFLARPENLLAAALLPVLLLLAAARPGDARRAWGYLIALGALVVLDTFAKWRLFGDPLPLSYYAKRGGYYAGYAGLDKWNPVGHLLEAVLALLPFLLALTLFARRGEARRITALLAPVAVTWAALFGTVQIMGSHARFLYPLAPCIVVAAVLAVDGAFSGGWRPARPGGGRLVAAFALAGLVVATPVRHALAAAWSAVASSPPAVLPALPRYEVAAAQPIPRIGWWRAVLATAETARRLPAGASLALSEVGWVGAVAGHVRLFDLAGLNDPEFAHRGFSAERLLDRAPDLIWLPHEDYRGIVASILADDRFWLDYDYYPGAMEYGLAVRRAGPRRAAVLDALRPVWAALYGDASMETWRARRLDGPTLR